ncbi:hypothetical protein [Mesorhizobium sp. M1B.F.Ca.ET.045.04.1.1]|uniref:hypothetical protein n=1 Tax=Mesorhizobium sp. M1B.F.Ca.ET.045.04.1.1 TaxID=2493673 RepID=UPI000F74DE6B|nr:hypothetical protein [Mesorhizobium sp. M1B.F.Ca.ET.045.04.1.1]AZO32492.1 hypothetical protein EJ071_37695 [Mesorhizobium sp. M1B.F.Ca.ET.045.04.1.1]
MTIRLLHQTDLFRPSLDPDDHWDLACVFALAASGQLELGGVLVDFPLMTLQAAVRTSPALRS